MLPSTKRRLNRQNSIPIAFAFRVQTVTLVWLVLFLSPFVLPQTNAEDRVVLRPNKGTSRIILRGNVLEYTGRTLTLETSVGGKSKTYPAEQVIEVTTPQVASHQLGVSQLEANQIDKATESLQKAFREEDRNWVRREILALLIKAALHKGDYIKAGNRFLILMKSDPNSRHARLMPLMWRPSPLNPPTKAEARVWFTAESEDAQLMGASFLLNDAQYGTLAKQTLETFRTSTNNRLAALSRAQLIRLRLHKSEVSTVDLKLWEDHLQHMPDELRGGLYFLLGQAHKRRGEHEQAAVAFLRLPVLYPDDHLLAALACFEAADALERRGQIKQAIPLYQEVVSMYGDTPFSDDAQARLNKYLSPQESAPSP